MSNSLTLAHDADFIALFDRHLDVEVSDLPSSGVAADTGSEELLDTVYHELTNYLTDYVVIAPPSWTEVVQVLNRFSRALFLLLVHDVYNELLRREKKPLKLLMQSGSQGHDRKLRLRELDVAVFRDVCCAVRDELRRRHHVGFCMHEDIAPIGARNGVENPGRFTLMKKFSKYFKYRAFSKPDSPAEMVLRTANVIAAQSGAKISNPLYKDTISANPYRCKAAMSTDILLHLKQNCPEHVDQNMADQFLLDRLKSVADTPRDRLSMNSHDREHLMNSIHAYLKINSRSYQLSPSPSG
ncbi:hypothetical protein NEOLEDRAFT_1224267 [Neolentinus lepideus HHB14362 ss-1]|uniref:Uncharacterized protein n=1 Tax=Neolentinus lepideus HHB14362 ss-1 TaxID=1314782 RepID=A0A165UUA2_9AGAM|nr:hypothetical protein NEOLEDRAFT_1224267 [Neolentinus lepideus HHB14362 ss-1]